MYVFVYGTLKRDEPNNHWLTNKDNGKSAFVSKGTTVEKYRLVTAYKHNIPFLLDQCGTGKHVEGEVFEIDEEMLSKLDIMEEYPKLYNRRQEKIRIGTNEDERVIEAWTYLFTQFGPELLSLPYLDNYTAGDSHNFPDGYRARYLRDNAVDHRVNAIDEQFLIIIRKYSNK